MTTIDLPWPDALAAALGRAPGTARVAVLVAVAAARGSVPREAGTAMVVTADGIVGTIGGGHLEFEATRIAREALADRDRRCGALVARPLPAGGAARPVLRRGRHAGVPRRRRRRRAVGRRRARRVPRRHSVRAARARRRGRSAASSSAGRSSPRPPRPGGGGLAPPTGRTRRRRRAAGADRIDRPGSTSRSSATATSVARWSGCWASLPARVRWIDSREHDFPAAVPANVEVVATDAPAAELAALPRGRLRRRADAQPCAGLRPRRGRARARRLGVSRADRLGVEARAVRSAASPRAAGRPTRDGARGLPDRRDGGPHRQGTRRIAVAVAAELLARREAHARGRRRAGAVRRRRPARGRPAVDGGAAVAAGKRA